MSKKDIVSHPQLVKHDGDVEYHTSGTPCVTEKIKLELTTSQYEHIEWLLEDYDERLAELDAYGKADDWVRPRKAYNKRLLTDLRKQRTN